MRFATGLPLTRPACELRSYPAKKPPVVNHRRPQIPKQTAEQQLLQRQLSLGVKQVHHCHVQQRTGALTHMQVRAGIHPRQE